MITYKGNPLVRGKHFIYEGSIVEYVGKVYGDKHLFKMNESELILEDPEVLNLKSLLEHSLLAEQDNADDLYQVVTSYTDKQLDICSKFQEPTSWKELQDSFQSELNELSNLGLSYTTSYNDIEGDSKYLLDTIQTFLKDTQRNISDTSMPNIYTQLSNFIYNISKLKGSE